MNFGKWKKYENIGSGGNASVFKVVDEHDKYYALKMLVHKKDKTKLKRFKRECYFLEKYNDLVKNNVILPLIDKNLNCDKPYYVMPLAIPLKKYKFSSLDEKCSAIRNILNDIRILHNMHIAHRDIKPENILLYNGKFYLSDFGLLFIEKAQRITKDKNERIGAKRTIAPELERNNAFYADKYKADIYSIAKTIWMILTEDYECFEGQYNSNTIVALENYPNIGHFEEGVTATLPYYTPLDVLLTECTDHNPKNRPSIDFLIEHFEKWIEINSDFHLINNYEWIEITNKLFPINIPSKVIWTKQEDIIDTLNFICKYKSLAYVFLPLGGQHFKSVKKASESNFIEFDMNGLSCIFPAKSLTFYCMGNKCEWNYFRLDAYENIKPKFLKDIPSDNTEAFEDLTELYPNNYAPYEVWESDDEYKGYVPTKEMRRICRYYRGTFVLFNTRSSYNLETSTHNRHSMLSKEEFEFYIKGCSIGRFSLKYKEFDAEEIKRIFAEEEQGPINN